MNNQIKFTGINDKKRFFYIKLFYFEIFCDVVGSGVIKRWVFRTPVGSIRLHKILKSDMDRDKHDHTFWFISLILWNGYLEHQLDGSIKKYRIGNINFKRATDAHKLELLNNKTTWTLSITGRKQRKWGFHTANGWVEGIFYK